MNTKYASLALAIMTSFASVSGASPADAQNNQYGYGAQGTRTLSPYDQRLLEQGRLETRNAKANGSRESCIQEDPCGAYRLGILEPVDDFDSFRPYNDPDGVYRSKYEQQVGMCETRMQRPEDVTDFMYRMLKVSRQAAVARLDANKDLDDRTREAAKQRVRHRYRDSGLYKGRSPCEVYLQELRASSDFYNDNDNVVGGNSSGPVYGR